MKHNKFNLATFFTLILFVLVGCSSEDVLTKDDISTTGKSLVMRIPAISTRADEGDGTATLTAESLSFFLFKQGGVFLYSPKENNVTVKNKKNSLNKNKVEYEVEFKIPDTKYGQVDMIVLHNYEGGKPAYNQTLADFQEKNLIVKHKKIVDPKYANFFYGKTTFHANGKNIETEVKLVRPVAQVEIFIDKDTNKEQNTDKIIIKSLRSIHIYRIPNQSSLSYDDEADKNKDGVVETPTIPNDKENKLEETFTYKIEGLDCQQFNDIYLPERKHEEKASRSDVTAIVVGVTTDRNSEEDGNSDDISYYRIDFAEYEGITPINFKSILRNHLYRFKLGSALNPGETTPEEALDAKSVVWVSFKEWENEKIDYVLHGQYYFGLESTKVILPGEKESKKEVSFDTNLNLKDLDKLMKLSLDDGEEISGLNIENEYFSVNFNTDTKKIKISTRQDNNTLDSRHSQLKITVLKQVFLVDITQEKLEPAYTLSCEDTKVLGSYKVGKTLDATNKIQVKIISDKSLTSNYIISTDKVDGISFYAEGKLNLRYSYISGKYEQTIELMGEGTLVEKRNKEMTITCNALNNPTCKATVIVVNKPVQLVAFSSNHSSYGYGLNNNLSGLFRDSEDNFGPNGTVLIKHKLEKDNYYHFFSSEHKFRDYILANKADIDIIVLAQGATYYKVVDNLVDFIKKGGVLICLANSKTFEIVNRLYNDKSLNLIQSEKTGSEIAFNTIIDDPIMNGSFGLINENKFWGVHRKSSLSYVSGLPGGEKIYSGDEEEPYIFKHPDYNFIFIGDSRFISAPGGHSSNKRTFDVDESGKPIPSEDGYVNSIFFGNVMEWAIQQAQKNKKI